MSEHDFANLPNSWAIATVAQSGTVITGNTPPTSEQDNYGGTLPFIKPPHLQESGIHTSDQFLTERGASLSRVLPPFSVLVSCIGNLGKTGINRCPVAFNQQINAIVPSEAFIPPFLFYQAQSPRFRQQLESRASATTISIVNKGNFETIRLAIPPLTEQRRIVGKVEELFSELDEGVANLKQARAQLAVYRQALLKHAFEGHLTADWRTKHAPELESADQLLARIRAEREERFQKQLKEWEAKLASWEKGGERGARPRKPREPKELRPFPDEVREKLSNLPASWAWDVLGWMTNGVEYGSAAKSSESGTHVVLRMGNLQSGHIDWDDLAYSSDPEEIDQYLLKFGDVLFNRTNSPEWVGKTAIYRGERPALFAGYLIRINHSEEIVLSEYLNWFLNSPVAKQHGNTVKTDGVNQSNINGDKLVNYPFPYCSLAEQAEVVRILEGLISLVDRSVADIDLNLQKAEALRQSILKKAFAGELVPQDPADEPAAALLARIRAEREAQTTKTTKRNTRR